MHFRVFPVDEFTVVPDLSCRRNHAKYLKPLAISIAPDAPLPSVAARPRAVRSPRAADGRRMQGLRGSDFDADGRARTGWQRTSRSAGAAEATRRRPRCRTIPARMRSRPPATVRAPSCEGLARHIVFHRTPKHDRWWDSGRRQLNGMTLQCPTGRRVGDPETLRREIRAWPIGVGGSQRGVGWQMTADDARRKLKSVCSRTGVRPCP